MRRISSLSTASQPRYGPAPVITLSRTTKLLFMAALFYQSWRQRPLCSLARTPQWLSKQRLTLRSGSRRSNPPLHRTSSLSTGQEYQGQPHMMVAEGATLRSGLRRPDPLLRRTSSLSTVYQRLAGHGFDRGRLSRPRKQFINGRPRASASGYFIKDSAAPMATLPTNGHFIKASCSSGPWPLYQGFQGSPPLRT